MSGSALGPTGDVASRGVVSLARWSSSEAGFWPLVIIPDVIVEECKLSEEDLVSRSRFLGRERPGVERLLGVGRHKLHSLECALNNVTAGNPRLTHSHINSATQRSSLPSTSASQPGGDWSRSSRSRG